ncbi:hypothetical protein Catovirus_1_675 [Catovirus CTV1]|uniref:Uncharacterized protein n=1 Tax=Catovirus CTV1 TaxID=1977631 RepID=A0A1V0SA74_9VIRU|nr:hypothetical protein Catovirus_1_675 [Catovirus CTV1]
MVLCFDQTPKSIENLEKEFSEFVSKKYENNKDIAFEMLIPARLALFSQNLLNQQNIKNQVVDKEIFYRKYLEGGPEDVWPPIQYEYNRPCIMLNDKVYKLMSVGCDEKSFKEKYIVLRTN